MDSSNGADLIKCVGEVEMIVTHEDGTETRRVVKNAVLNTGRAAIVNSLTNTLGGSFQNYVTKMLFGTNGTVAGVPRAVEATQIGLFGPTVVAKPVIAQVNATSPNQAVFTSVLTKLDAVGAELSEMALQMKNGDLFSMTTFGDITKSSTSQLTFVWRISML